MLKRCSCSVLFLPLVLLLNGVLIALEVILLQAGTGSLDNAEHVPRFYSFYAVIIDADQYETTAGGEKGKGLPDSHDFSKSKDFFAIYPALYCSGKKIDGRYEADYCSPWGKQLFDLQLWRVWGVDLVENYLIGQSPRIIYISLMTAASAAVASLAFGVLGFCWYWSKALATVTIWVSAVAIITTSAVSQIFVSKLVAESPRLQVAGTGAIIAKWGYIYLRGAWALSGGAVVAAILWSIILWRARKARGKSGRTVVPVGYFPSGKRSKGKTYQHLAKDQEELADLRDTLQVKLVAEARVQSRNPSREPSPARYSKGDTTSQDTAYEPMRHRDVG
ncbi:hypothetical protein B0T25DRAFT_596146 [Lasiosphaeria hispida]|uniref:Uncharacterized protein n=1 Tax=Lasiosphaeria hispida TaxID=260671 RepID=A0AAJ0HUH6_9PEZI|nr:hypothetical protein B0T25DRAFT_596146 [Lasiosphaeria hispida]